MQELERTKEDDQGRGNDGKYKETGIEDNGKRRRRKGRAGRKTGWTDGIRADRKRRRIARRRWVGGPWK